MAHTLYELDVRLHEIEPPIWRTIEVAGSASLEDVHLAIQVAMGWTNSHLHMFVIDGERYGMTDVGDSADLELEDERQYLLQDLGGNCASFVYDYDFGDSWGHDVTVKKVTTVAKSPRPRCTAGARACPPEDCGGAGGYADLLRVLADRKDPEHAASVTWSNNFKAEQFSVPKNGLELTKEMTHLRKLADNGRVDDIGVDDMPSMEIDQKLVEAVLALEPMQRASLGAVISGSLADELIQARTMAEQLIGALQKQTKPVRRAHKRAR